MKSYIKIVIIFSILIFIPIIYIAFNNMRWSNIVCQNNEEEYKQSINEYSPRIAILIISSTYNKNVNKKTLLRWKNEKERWLRAVRKNKFNNIDTFFLETDPNASPNSVSIKNNTILCGIKDSYVPGILHKTLLGLKVLPNYDFYIRTNLSTVINYKTLNNYLEDIQINTFFSTGKIYKPIPFQSSFLCKKHQKDKGIIVSKILENNLPYYGNTKNNDNKWFLGYSIIFSKKYAELLVDYLDNVPYILESTTPDDVLLGILIGSHNEDIDEKCKTWSNYSNPYYLYNNEDIIFHRCKGLDNKKSNIINNCLNY